MVVIVERVHTKRGNIKCTNVVGVFKDEESAKNWLTNHKGIVESLGKMVVSLGSVEASHEKELSIQGCNWYATFSIEEPKIMETWESKRWD